MTIPDRSSWGNSTLNANDAPEWNYLNNEMNGSQANVVATAGGWAIQHPWGKETIVAMGGLTDTAKYPASGVLRYNNLSVTSNVAAEHLKVKVTLNKGVDCVDANTANVYLNAVCSDANVATPKLVYNPTLSDPHAGELVFEATNVDLSLAVANSHLTINVSNGLHGANSAFWSRRTPKYALVLSGSVVIGIN